MNKKQKIFLYIGIGVLLFLVVFAFYFYRKGKKTTTISNVPNDLASASGSGVNNPAGVSASEIKLLANELYDDMDGLNFWNGHNLDPYKKLLTYSDTDFVKVYNTFNELYQKENQETLIQMIYNEWQNNSSAWNSIRDTVLDRAVKLNLK